jgi:hypothetical protein
MKNMLLNQCYRIRYPNGSPIDFRTQQELPVAFHLMRVKLRDKRIINLIELLMEPWDSFSEIECTDNLTGHVAAFW